MSVKPDKAYFDSLDRRYIDVLKDAMGNGPVPNRLGWMAGDLYVERQVWPEDKIAVSRYA